MSSKNPAGGASEPLIHITKRKHLEWYQSWLIRLLAIGIALVICAIVTSVTTVNFQIKSYYLNIR